VNKEKQESLSVCVRAGWSGVRPMDKSFLVLFFKKEQSFLLCWGATRKEWVLRFAQDDGGRLFFCFGLVDGVGVSIP
jgi:hypothetical protein